MCACFLSLSSSLRCKLKKLNHRARPLQARATPDDEGQGEGKGSHDGSPRQVDDERLTLSHLNQLSRRLDRRGGHSFRNHASHGGAQRELSGHKARFLVSFKSSKRKRARAYKHPSPPSDASRASTVNSTRHRTSPHRTGSHIDASATPYAWKSRPACATLSTPQPRYDPTPAIDAAAPRARKAIAHRSHTRTHIIHMHRSRAVCDTPMRECATTPRSLARDRFAIPKPHPRASSRARIAPSRDVPHRPRAHRRDARVSHASAPRAIATRRRTQRPRRRARRDGVLSSPRDSGHRIASHRKHAYLIGAKDRGGGLDNLGGRLFRGRRARVRDGRAGRGGGHGKHDVRRSVPMRRTGIGPRIVGRRVCILYKHPFKSITIRS